MKTKEAFALKAVTFPETQDLSCRKQETPWGRDWSGPRNSERELGQPHSLGQLPSQHLLAWPLPPGPGLTSHPRTDAICPGLFPGGGGLMSRMWLSQSIQDKGEGNWAGW
jgi:hypothetical protein